jgi:hypothetical protein
MADIKSLLYSGAVIYNKVTLQEFAVKNFTETPENGGCCLLWTVPADSTYIKFEMWGGGGGGGGACCCMQGFPGGGGSYGTKELTGSQVRPGCTYTICAAATTGAAPSNNGCTGYTSFVQGHNLSNFCAIGGTNGCTNCNAWQGNCYQCSMCSYRCNAYGGDLNVSSSCGGSRVTFYCFNQAQQWATVAPATVSGPVFGPAGCSCVGIGYESLCKPIFPGGGGFSGQHYAGGCFCGWYGGAGLVLVTYG